MLSRNQIRQTALQYLYGASQSPEITGEQEEGIWDILMEPFRADYCKLRRKPFPATLRVTTRTSCASLSPAPETAEKLQHDPLTLPVRDQLHDLLNKEGEFNAALLQLKKALHDDPANDRKTLSAACDAVQELNTALMQMRGRLLDSLRDFPVYNSIWTPLIPAAATSGNNDPHQLHHHQDGRPSLAEVKKVVEAGQDAEELYREAKTLGEETLRRREELDSVINGILENYSPERVSTMDRAILRLGACELLHRKNLPAPVVISEAIRLAERFSSADSPRFVNGVLAGIAKTARPS